MNITTKDPIVFERTSCEAETACAAEVVAKLATFEVSQIPDEITPYLAAAGAEMALVAGIRWRFSADEAVVALLRIASRAAMAMPSATGPHIQRLFEQLEEL